MKDKDIFKTVDVNSWSELKNILTDLKPGYIFRGQTKFGWDLKTTIERISAKHLWQAEKRMLHEFEKNIYNFDLNRIPNSKLEKLLFLQHFGAPTRLIDFTESPYVASFFALNTRIEDDDSEEFSSIYAIHTSDLFHRIATFGDDKFINFFEEKDGEATGIYSMLNKPEIFDELVMRYNHDINFIVSINPTYHHERSNPQASVHITIGNLKNSFLKNFAHLIKYSASEFGEASYIKFKFHNKIRKEALYNLNLMNINYSSVAPN